jgi:eukaryotic-like serine/threonine-protein kinase
MTAQDDVTVVSDLGGLDAPPARRGEELADGYRCIALLRRGEAFDVYDAWSSERHCRCVVKVLRPGVDTPELRRRLLLEGRLLTRLDHPHLLRGYEVRREPPLAVSRTVCGVMLDRLVESGSRLSAADLALLGGQLAAGLRFLHAHGYVHLDVKPSNVAIDNGSAVLIDYSLVQRPGRVRAGTGTPRSMAPEQVYGGLVGPFTDAWGLGVVLFEAAAGRSPFRTPADRTAAPTLRRFRRNLPRAFTDLVDQCLQAAPARRLTVDAVLACCDALASTGLPA